MARSLQRWLARLETLSTPAAPVAIAWQDTGEPGIDADTVQLAGGERMTLDEWRRCYANGLLIHVVYGDVDADEPALEYLNKAR
jgi:hypothetical protein